MSGSTNSGPPAPESRGLPQTIAATHTRAPVWDHFGTTRVCAMVNDLHGL